MPLNGAGLASKPSGTTAVSNTTIESSKFNSVIDDIYSIFNTARPVAYGGTGGTSVITGWDGLAAKGTDIATASSINLTTATGPSLTLTGTTTITGVTLAEGSIRIVRAAGAFQITASASLLCNGSAVTPMTVAAEDLLVFRGGAAGVVSVARIGSASVAAATTSAAGIVELATLAETLAGTDTGRVPSVSTLYFPTGHLHGLGMANGTDATNDINFSAGTCRDSSDSQNIIATAKVKQLDANWAAGTNQGGRYSGAAITNTTYHCYAVAKALGADPDFYFDPSPVEATVLGHLQAETGGADYLYVRRIGSIVRVSNAIKAFSQNGDEFLWLTGVLDVNASTPGTSAVLRTLSVPTGIKVISRARYTAVNTALAVQGGYYVSSPDQTDVAPGGAATDPVTDFGFVATTTGQLGNSTQRMDIRTNTSGQVRTRNLGSDANCSVLITTYGWIDTRGRLGA
jgi:hypothetical protein